MQRPYEGEEGAPMHGGAERWACQMGPRKAEAAHAVATWGGGGRAPGLAPMGANLSMADLWARICRWGPFSC